MNSKKSNLRHIFLKASNERALKSKNVKTVLRTVRQYELIFQELLPKKYVIKQSPKSHISCFGVETKLKTLLESGFSDFYLHFEKTRWWIKLSEKNRGKACFCGSTEIPGPINSYSFFTVFLQKADPLSRFFKMWVEIRKSAF